MEKFGGQTGCIVGDAEMANGQRPKLRGQRLDRRGNPWITKNNNVFLISYWRDQTGCHIAEAEAYQKGTIAGFQCHAIQNTSK